MSRIGGPPTTNSSLIDHVVRSQEGHCNALRRLNELMVPSSTWKKNTNSFNILIFIYLVKKYILIFIIKKSHSYINTTPKKDMDVFVSRIIFPRILFMGILILLKCLIINLVS